MIFSGVYAIEHKDSGRKYIGSAKDFRKRWDGHRWWLRKDAHHSSYLQRAWNKYGEDAFEFRKLLICAPKDLLMYEQHCIDGFDSFLSGFNGRQRASNSMLGMKHSPETKSKIGTANTGKRRTAEAKIKMRDAKLGKPQTKTTIEARAKLTFLDVADIRAIVRKKRCTQRLVAALFDVSAPTVSSIVRGSRWPPIAQAFVPS